MNTEVYADLYLIINFCMDFICILISALLLHRKISRLRAFFASLFGASYALAALLLCRDGVFGMLLDLLAGLLLCFIVFFSKKQPPLGFFTAFGVYFLTSTLMGGIMTALYYWLNRFPLSSVEMKKDGLSTWLFALLALVAGGLTLKSGRWMGTTQKQKIVEIRMSAFGKEKRFLGLIDSGNLLKDPLSGKSVIVIERKELVGMFPPALLLSPTDPRFEAWASDYKHAITVRLIPTKSATSVGLLAAISPKELEIITSKGSYPSDCLVAAGEVESKGKNFHALVPSES